jgi:DNA helicase-2/ATP-dependent DNA helicase PcrA
VESLHKEFARLNAKQKVAVSQTHNTVVFAGPGSGKTATLVLKAAYLLAEKIPPPRGLACITYNNEAAAEFRNRLEALGVRAGARVFLGTVHSFCLNCIIRPFSSLIDSEVGDVEVVPDAKALEFLKSAANKVGPDLHPFDLKETITKLRSRIACREDHSGFADSDLKILELYQKALTREGLIDFEGIVEKALEIIRDNAWVGDFLLARFPWILVDEYQDLGGPLHKIIEEMVAAGIHIFSVGDPDQCIYDFTGAEPSYFLELTKRNDFETVRLSLNYRSGKKLIAASQAALAESEPRDYKPDPTRTDEGEVLFFKGPSTDDHPIVIVNEVIPELVARGLKHEDIAVFYKRKGRFLSELTKALDDAGIPYFLEKNDKYSRTRITRWLQQIIQAGLELDQGRLSTIDLDHLERTYDAMLIEALGGVADPLGSRTALFQAITSVQDPHMPLSRIFKSLDKFLDISRLMKIPQDLYGDRDTWSSLSDSVEPGKPLDGYTAEDFSMEGKKQGKITLTTNHSSKGRQFPAIVIPELVNEVFPERPWDLRKLRWERRLFYVAFTRAKAVVALVFGNVYRKRNGDLRQTDISPFAREVHKRLKEQ